MKPVLCIVLVLGGALAGAATFGQQQTGTVKPTAIRLAVPGRQAPPATELERQYVALLHDLRNRAQSARVAAQTFRQDALILSTDRDPLDVVLRRTAALLDDLKRMPQAPDLAVPAKELHALRAEAERLPVAKAEARYALYEQACRLRRRVAFANPLLDFAQLLFLKRHRSLTNHMCDQYYGMTAQPGGGLYVLTNPFGPNPTLRDVLAGSVVTNGRLKGAKLSGGPGKAYRLSYDWVGNLSGETTEGGAFLSPDLSYDGKSILFAYVECQGDRRHHHHTDPKRGHWTEGRCYHVFQVGVDGSHLTQLTDGTWNDFDPCWLPNGRIAFISERRGGYLRCGRVCPTYTLYDMAANGSDIRCLSLHETNEWHPSVTNDGQLIWTRWDYVDRHGCTAHMPWLTTLDGRDPRPVHGNYATRHSRPDMELNVRAIPGSHKFVATAAPHHGQAFGSLVVIDPHTRDDDGMAPLKRLTPDIAFPETQRGTETYGSAWPLSTDYYLCAYDAAMEVPELGAKGNYGLYLVDSFGNKELLYRDPAIACQNPIPLRARPMPPAAQTMTIRNDALRSNPATRHLAPPAQPPQEAAVAVLDVYDSRYAWPPDTKIKALRVYQVLPMTVPSGRPPHEIGWRVPEARDSVVPARAVLGTVPVEADGSAHFLVPSYKEVFFQALDEHGRAVLSMRSATHTRPGERLVCQGCHADHSRAPQMRSNVPLALRRTPSQLQPDVDGSNPFSYPRLVQPVLDRHCVACHAKQPDKALNLARAPIQRNWYASYHNLLKYAFTSYGHPYRTTPGKFGARASKLLPLLENGHHGVKLNAEEMHRITLWLDSLSVFYGVYEREGGEAQLRGEIVRPTLE